jgi:general secretion pathway protein I
MRRRIRGGQSGFTLLEVVIAVAIIATGFFAVYSLHIQTLSVSYAVRFYTRAPLLAQAKLAEVTVGINDLSDQSGDFGEDDEGYTYTVRVSDVEHDLLGETAERMKKIDLQIVLGDGENTYDVTAYRYVEDDER